jgi:DNA sulfur modification protein DndB
MAKLAGGRGTRGLEVRVITLAEGPAIYLAALPGPWLLKHATPSLRIDDPEKGFQRVVKEHRAKEIARTVLDSHRCFPNAITLATRTKEFSVIDGTMRVPSSAKFLVVDGQHRLWAQKFSDVAGIYPCMIHMDRTPEQMAELFLEINDNQRKVPSSLRWDLVRLVRDDEQYRTLTADIVYELATRKESPFDAIDLTGEKKEITIKQGSLAPEIESLVKRHLRKLGGDLDDYVGLLIRFFVALRSLDPDGWGDPKSDFYKARVLRALLRVLSDLLDVQPVDALTAENLRDRLARIDRTKLSEEEVRRVQGSAGVQDLYETIRGPVLGSAE